MACRTEKERKGKEAGLGGIAEAGKAGRKNASQKSHKTLPIAIVQPQLAP